jgi:hypothetical protein
MSAFSHITGQAVNSLPCPRSANHGSSRWPRVVVSLSIAALFAAYFPAAIWVASSWHHPVPKGKVVVSLSRLFERAGGHPHPPFPELSPEPLNDGEFDVSISQLQSSSCSRRTASLSGFFDFSHVFDRPLRSAHRSASRRCPPHPACRRGQTRLVRRAQGAH